MNTRLVTVGGLLVALAAIFQTFPLYFSEAFSFVTMFSALPIFCCAKLNNKLGITAYLAAILLVMLFTPHEALLFAFTNGVVGLGLGYISNHIPNKILVAAINSLVMTSSLSIVNFGIGIPIFGKPLPFALINQLAIIFGFAFFYSMLYLWFANYIYRKLNLSSVISK